MIFLLKISGGKKGQDTEKDWVPCTKLGRLVADGANLNLIPKSVVWLVHSKSRDFRF